MDEDLLALFANALNYLIFLYIFISIVRTQCFNPFEQGISLFGLGVGIIIQLITVIIRRIEK